MSSKVTYSVLKRAECEEAFPFQTLEKSTLPEIQISRNRMTRLGTRRYTEASMADPGQAAIDLRATR